MTINDYLDEIIVKLGGTPDSALYTEQLDEIIELKGGTPTPDRLYTSKLATIVDLCDGGSDKLRFTGGCAYPEEQQYDTMTLSNGKIEIETKKLFFTKAMNIKVSITYAEVSGSSSSPSDVSFMHNDVSVDRLWIPTKEEIKKEYTLSVVAGDYIGVYKHNVNGWGTAKAIVIEEI